MKYKKRLSKLSMNLGVCLMIFTFMLFSVHAGNPELPVNLGSADNYVILTKTGITNTGSHTSAITGDIGSSPITAAAMNGVFCSEITGTIYGSDAAYTGSGDVTCFAGTPADTTLVANAVLDMGTAYTDATARTLPDATELGAGDISGLVITPGLYKWSSDVVINTDVTLNGNANDVWIFQIAGDLTVASGASVPAGTKVILTGGAQASNVYWQVGASNFGATLGTYSTFNGNILSAKQVIIQTGAVLNGRALADTQVTLDANPVTIPALLVGNSSNATNSTVILGTPTNNTWKNNATPIFTFKYTGDLTANCTLYVEGVAYGTNNSATNNTNTAIIANASLNQGNNSWHVNCTDTSGNVESLTRLVKIDTIVPIVNLLNPINNGWITGLTPTFIFNYTDASATASCTLYVNGTAKRTNNSVVNNTNTVITSNTSLNQGDNWYVNCTDLAGNKGNSTTRTVLVDSIYPQASINNINGISNGQGTTNTTLIINFTANDANLINWTLLLYNSTGALLQNWTENTTNTSVIETYTVDANGTYYLNLTVIDNAANANTTSFTIYVDQSTPEITGFTLSPTSVYTGDTITGTCVATDNYSSTTTTITGIDTSTTGAKTATCTATDLAGNSAIAAYATYTVNPRPSSGGGSGGGCSPSWICTDWSECLSNGNQLRSCNDTTRCYSARNESQSCTYIVPTGTSGTGTTSGQGTTGSGQSQPETGSQTNITPTAGNDLTGQVVAPTKGFNWWLALGILALVIAILGIGYYAFFGNREQ